MNIDTIVRQDTYDAFKEHNTGRVRLNRRGEPVLFDPFQQLVADGRVFIASNTAMETADVLGDASYANTVAALAIDVPAGVTIKPLEIVLIQGGTVAGGDITVLMTLDDKVRITSGVKCAVSNYQISASEVNASLCDVYQHKEGTTNLVVAANAEDNTFFAKMCAEDIVGGDEHQVIWTARKYPAPTLKGPAALVVHAYPAAGAGPSFFWHMLWAEYRTGEVV